jgi:hypothetical protein
MWPFMVVEMEVAFESLSERRYRALVFPVKVLILDRSPEPFNKDIVQRAAPAIHADGDAFPRQAACKGKAGELDSLVGAQTAGWALCLLWAVLPT